MDQKPLHRRRQRKRQTARVRFETQPRCADAEELRDAGHRHRGGQDRRRAKRCLRVEDDESEHDRDQHTVEHDETERRRGHLAGRVQGGRRHGDDTGHRNIGHRQAHELDRQRKALALAAETWCEEMHDQRREYHACDCKAAQRCRHGAKHLLAELARRRGTVLVADAQRHRHEGRIERAFRQQTSKQVRDLQRCEIGVGQRPRSEHGGNAGIAQEPKQA